MAISNDYGIPHSEFLSWDEDDQDKAILYRREMRMVCPSCGTRKQEWDEDRYAYIADSEICMGCEVLEQERENIPEGQQGARIFLVKNLPGTETSDGFEQRLPPDEAMG